MADFDSRTNARILTGVFAVLVLLCCQDAFAVPMRCSGEQTACIAACKKNLDRSYVSICVTNCGARQSMCMRDSGVQKYCGLLKQ